jgi:hypothetical protein
VKPLLSGGASEIYGAPCRRSLFFEEALIPPFDALVIDAAGPNRMVIGRDVLLTLVNIARSEPDH